MKGTNQVNAYERIKLFSGHEPLSGYIGGEKSLEFI